jgi:hypothetical protein
MMSGGGAAMDRRLAVLASSICDGGGGSSSSSRLAATSGREGSATSAPAAAKHATGTPRLLSDSEMLQFVRDGFLHLPLDEFDDAFHAELHSQSERLYELSGGKGGAALGNNIYPALGGLGDVMQSRAIRGALESVCGPLFSTSAHRFMHESTGQGEQTFHKDGAYRSTVNLRPRVVMVLYVPGGASLEMGPTSILPRSQILGLDKDETWPDFEQTMPCVYEHKLVVPEGKGAAVLIHYDLVHRGSARLVDKDGALWRPMHKWQFLRTQEPTAPTWDHDPNFAPSFGDDDILAPVYKSVWSWLCGAAPPVPKTSPAQKQHDVEMLAGCVQTDRVMGDEPERLAAAHLLGQAAYHGDEAALGALAHGLTDSREATRRSSVHGLAAAADAANPAALAALAASEPRAIGLGADVLGESALHPTVEVVQAVSAALDHLAAVIVGATEELASGAHDLNRSGKGAMGPEWLAVQACVQCLSNLAQRCQPASEAQQFAAIVSALTPHLRSESDEVRRKAAEAMMPLANCDVAEIRACCGEATATALVDGLRHCLLDPNRYVLASGAEGLLRLGAQQQQRQRQEQQGMCEGKASASARQAVLTELVDKRWCPVTNPASQF